MGIAAIFGTAFGIIGVSLVLATFRENKRAADAAHDANRPWLEPVIEKTGKLQISKDHATLWVRFHIYNRGNSPAVNVEAYAEIVPCQLNLRDMNPDRIVEGVEVILDRWEGREVIGSTVFPGELWAYEYQARTSTEKMIESLGVIKSPILYLGFGVRYRFGDKSGRTSMARFIELPERYLFEPLGEDETETVEVSLGDLSVSRAT